MLVKIIMQTLLEVPELMTIISKIGIEQLTDPQKVLVENFFAHSQSNICLHANNGTGKTIGYFMLGLALLLEQQNLRLLILVPTRELAFQVYNLFNIASRSCTLASIIPKMLVGGLSLAEDRSSLSNIRPNVIVGTGGRVLQMFKLEAISLSDFALIVFDEYDKLFENKEFIHILKLIKRQQLTLLPRPRFVCVSATFVPGRFKALKQSIRGVKSFSVGKTSIKDGEAAKAGESQKIDINLASIRQYYVAIPSETSAREHITAMIKFLCKSISYRKALIFYNDKVNGDDLWQDFRDTFPGVEIIYIHGDLVQRQRFKLFNKFRHQDLKMAITTDLLARGVDFDNVDLVLNFDLPHNAATYFHRIGRCGRNNNPGVSFIFLTQKMKDHLQESWLYTIQMTKFNVERAEEELRNINSYLSAADHVFLKTDAVRQEGLEDVWMEAGYQVYDHSRFKYVEESEPEEAIDEAQINHLEMGNKLLPFEDEIFNCSNCQQLLLKMRTHQLLSSDLYKYFNDFEAYE